MEDCVFCKIVRGEIPCHKVYEDETFLAFLDINPVNDGHTLVIPKTHFRNLFDFDAQGHSAYLEKIQYLALKICLALGAKDFNVINANGAAAQQSVDHLHFHIVPRFPNDGIDLSFHGRKSYNQDDLAAIRRKISGD